MADSPLPRWYSQAERQVNKALNQLDQLADRLTDRDQNIVITGLSRSGKSMLFTALIAQLQQQISQNNFDALPLLGALPKARLQKIELTTEFPQVTAFPFQSNLAALQNRQWPPATQQVSAFRLTIWLKQSNAIKQKLIGSKRLSLFFYDYPGEWLMDLPLLKLDYASWSAQVFAQMASEPQAGLAKDWLQSLRQFNFDQVPTAQAVFELVSAYQTYLLTAKAQGLSLLQPGALILPPPGLDLACHGFCPLPNKLLSDPSHPWTLIMQQHYQQFVRDWVQPFKTEFFNQADKQIMLVDVLEGLHFGRGYLEEMKEAISHLSTTFVYGKQRWYQRLGRSAKISQVAFVATKLDLIPQQQHINLMSLLKTLTQGARASLALNPQVQFDHFLIAAMVSTKIEADAVVYKDQAGQTHRVLFETLPTQLHELAGDEHYPQIKALPPKLDNLADWQSLGLDKLLNYVLLGALK